MAFPAGSPGPEQNRNVSRPDRAPVWSVLILADWLLVSRRVRHPIPRSRPRLQRSSNMFTIRLLKSKKNGPLTVFFPPQGAT